MKNRAFNVSLAKNPLITMDVIPGHFTTSQFHISHYLGVSKLKTNALIAKNVAEELAVPYLANNLVDTIVCMEGTEVIGAYMAQELLQEGTAVINSGKDIHVVTPMSNVNGNLIFHSNAQELIFNRNTILLVASISSGRTINSALECLSYYGGILVGISALFNAYPETSSQEIHSMFTSEDIPEYQILNPDECSMCKAGRKLDAIIINGDYVNI